MARAPNYVQKAIGLIGPPLITIDGRVDMVVDGEVVTGGSKTAEQVRIAFLIAGGHSIDIKLGPQEAMNLARALNKQAGFVIRLAAWWRRTKPKR